MKNQKVLNAGEISALSYKSPETDEERQRYSQQKCDWYNNTAGDLHLSDGYDCPLCKNKGYIQKPVKSEFGYWTEMHYLCKCQKIRRVINRMKRSGLQKTISECTFEKYEAATDWHKHIKEKAQQFIKDTGGSWFFIGGQSGCGKTHICTAICRHFLYEDKEVRYMVWREDVTNLKANVTEAEQYTKMIDEYKKAEVLYIDDLFKTGKADGDKPQKPTAADINIAFELLNYRYNNPDLITIISSECMIMDILEIDEATGGRIAEKAGAYSLNIKPDRAKNYRLKDMLVL